MDSPVDDALRRAQAEADEIYGADQAGIEPPPPGRCTVAAVEEINGRSTEESQVPKRRRSENRQRTLQLKLRLLPQEEELLRRHAEANRFPSMQAYILHRLPEITTEPLDPLLPP